MNKEEQEINTFFNDVSDSFSNNGYKNEMSFSINDDLLNKKECYYIFDLTKGKITFHKGFDKLFGYTDSEISFDFILKNYHPDDKETILRISKATISHCLSSPFECKDSLLQITYRFNNNNGIYLKILSQSSAFKINKEGFMTCILVKLTDISFLENTNYVNWFFNATNLNVKAFKKEIYTAYNDFFTDRETEIIIGISKGHTTKIMAQRLNISEHTIATHRKNILKKANRHNIEDLILFCKRKGII